MDDVAQHNGRTIYRWTLTGTNTGPGVISGFEEWRFGDDRLVAESYGRFDAADYSRQLAT
jgi:hypothetical protein